MKRFAFAMGCVAIAAALTVPVAAWAQAGFAASIGGSPAAAGAAAKGAPTPASPAEASAQAIALPRGWHLVPDGVLGRVMILVQMDSGAAATLLGNELRACIQAEAGTGVVMGGVQPPCTGEYDAAMRVMSASQAAAVAAAVAKQKADDAAAASVPAPAASPKKADGTQATTGVAAPTPSPAPAAPARGSDPDRR